jgi:hypothetical protein
MHAPNPNTYVHPDPDHPSITNLTPQQVKAATLLAAGQSYTEIAIALSVGRTTVFRWRQLPEFAAYLNLLIRQAADETMLQSVHLMTASLQHVKQSFEDPATPPAEKTRLALRLLSLYSSPSFLKFLNHREDNPHALTNAEMLAAYNSAKDDDPHFEGDDRIIFLSEKHDLIRQAQAFDAQHPSPLNPIATDKLAPQPAAQARARTKMEHNGTPTRCSTAIDAALAGVRQQIAAIR